MCGVACLGRPGMALCVGSSKSLQKFCRTLESAMPQKRFKTNFLETVDPELCLEAFGDGFEEVSQGEFRTKLAAIGKESEFFVLTGIAPEIASGAEPETTPTAGGGLGGKSSSKKKRKGKRRGTALYCSSNTILNEDPPVDTQSYLSEDLMDELRSQNPNENASVYDYYSTHDSQIDTTTNGNENDDEIFRCRTELDEKMLEDHKHIIRHDHYETRSLDDLFPDQESLEFSKTFNSCAPFRNKLRDAIRHDMIFDANADETNAIQNQIPIYSILSTQQRYDELAKNKPLIGYWKFDKIDSKNTANTTNNSNSARIRMTKTTEILQEYLGSEAPTGDALFEAIGSLCNSTRAPYHWTEVVGVGATQNAQMGDKTPHAWHQDYGHLQHRKMQDEDLRKDTGNNYDEDPYPYQSNNHVFFAFPFEDDYHGTGVFSHLIKLKHEHWAKPKEDAAPGKSIFYEGIVPERYVVRPQYAPGRELVVFRDIDVLHSTPDIQYRTSIMRFG